MPLNRTGDDFFKYKESRTIGYEADANNDQKTLQARQQAIADGKLTAEEFDRNFEATPKSWYKTSHGRSGRLHRRARCARHPLARAFGDAAPSFTKLQEA